MTHACDAGASGPRQTRKGDLVDPHSGSLGCRWRRWDSKVWFFACVVSQLWHELLPLGFRSLAARSGDRVRERRRGADEWTRTDDLRDVNQLAHARGSGSSAFLPARCAPCGAVARRRLGREASRTETKRVEESGKRPGTKIGENDMISVGYGTMIAWFPKPGVARSSRAGGARDFGVLRYLAACFVHSSTRGAVRGRRDKRSETGGAG